MKSRTGAVHLVYADVMRTTAISVVVLSHLLFFTRPVIGHKALTFGYLGVWGVNCFFVLSGLLLGRPYLKAMFDERPFPSITGFYQRRFLRIYPLYFVVILLSIPLDFWYNHRFATAADIGTHLLLIQTLFTNTSTSLNGPLWTMGIDAGFYLILPLLALAFRPIVRGRSPRFKGLAMAAGIVVVAALCIAYRYRAYSTHPDAVESFAAATVYARNLIGFSMSFGLGFAIALATVTNVRITGAAAAALVAGGLALMATEFASKFGILGLLSHAIVRHHPLDDALLTIVRDTVLDPFAAVSAAAILFGIMQLNSRRAFAIAASKATAVAASTAYAVYLVHWVLLENADRYVMHERLGNVAFGEFVVLGLALVLPIAYALHVFVEKPFLTINERNRTIESASTVASQQQAAT